MYVEILILAHLSRQPAHGYEIKRSVEQSLGEAYAINNNQLYPTLRRFEEMGAITREVPEWFEPGYGTVLRIGD